MDTSFLFSTVTVINSLLGPMTSSVMHGLLTMFTVADMNFFLLNALQNKSENDGLPP